MPIVWLINVEVPTVVGILTSMNRKKSCSAELSMKRFYNFVARARGYKTFFMLNSVEHEILNAHKYIKIKKFGCF